MSNIYWYLGIYTIILLITTYFIGKKQTKEDFLISGRNRPWWQILTSKFSVAIGAAYFITYTGFAYEYKLGTFSILFGLLLGYLLFAYWAAPKIYENSKKEKFYTLGDFVYNKTKNKISRDTSNFMSNLIVLLWLMVSIVAGAKIIEQFGLISYELALILTVGVTLLYLLAAGYKAVIITDIIQAVIILGLLILITFSIVGSGDIISLFYGDKGGVDLITSVSFLLFGLLATFSSPAFYQLAYAGKNKRSIKHGLGLTIVPVIVIGFLLLLIGLFMSVNSPGLDSGLVFTEALTVFLPSSMLPLAIILFFAGIMSSADTNIYAIASHYSIPKKKGSLSHLKKSIIGVILLTLILGLLMRDIVDLTILAGGASLTLSLAMVYLLAGGKSSRKFLISTYAGLIGAIVGIMIFGINPSAAVPTLIGGALGLLWKK